MIIQPADDASSGSTSYRLKRGTKLSVCAFPCSCREQNSDHAPSSHLFLTTLPKLHVHANQTYPSGHSHLSTSPLRSRRPFPARRVPFPQGPGRPAQRQGSGGITLFRRVPGQEVVGEGKRRRASCLPCSSSRLIIVGVDIRAPPVSRVHRPLGHLADPVGC